MESLDNYDDKVPVLRISYEQLCEKIRTQDKERNLVERRDEIRRTDYLNKQVKHPTNRSTVRSRGLNERNGKKLATNLLKQSLESSSKNNVEKVWQKAWSQFTLYKADLDRTLSYCSSIDYARLETAIAQCTCLEDLGKQLYTTYIDVAFKHDLVTKIWRTTHYPVTELMRKIYKSAVDEEKSDLFRILTSFLDHLMDYYSALVKTLQQQCGFELSVLTGDNTSSSTMDDSFSSKTHHRKLKQAINVCHQCYIFMGDIARYSEELSSMPQWSRPRKYYLKSVHLVPKNGHPYNQLAVIARNSHRRLDAVYYYIRSLCSKNVFLSANDSLVAIFDETAKKAQTDELKEKTKLSKGKKKMNRAKKIESEKLRESNSHEVWIMPGRKPIDSNGKKELSSIANTEDISDPSELSRKLVNSFLIIHGKLFSRIGIETFDMSKANSLVLLKTYLKMTSVTATKDGERFVMMVAINVFSVHQKTAESQESDNQFYVIRSLSFGLEFITQLINRIPRDNHVTCVAESLVLLPCIRVWLGWFFNNMLEWISHSSLQSCIHEFLVGFSALLNYFTEIIQILEKDVTKVSSLDNKFWEDKLLAGFIPLALDGDYLSYPEVYSLSHELHYCQCMLRMRAVMDLGTQMVLSDMVPLSLATDTGKFSVTMEMAICPPLIMGAECADDSDDNYDEESDTEVVVSDDTGEDVSTQLQSLKLEKERLSKQMKSQLQTEKASQSLLNEAQSKTHAVTTIRPKYLVPDTNCFINNLDILRSLIDSGQFIIAVPLTVKAELDGLRKGSLLETDKDVTGPTQLAVDYISSNMGSCHSLRVLTSQGNLLSSLNITTELTDKATNDDLILTSCLKLHHRISDNSNNYCVVLLTDDRNLRVKSHASHMPVKNIKVFMDLYIQQNQC